MGDAAQETEGLLEEEPHGTPKRSNSGFWTFVFPPWRDETVSPPPSMIELLLVVAGCFALSVGAVICFYWQEVVANKAKYNAEEWANLVLSHCPLTAAIIFAALPQGKSVVLALPDDKILRAAIYPAVIISSWLFANLMRGHFNPLSFVCTVLFSFLYVCSSYSVGRETFTSSDAALIVAIAAMIDLRWIYSFWGGLSAFGYDWWSLAFSMMMIAAFNTARPLRHVSISFVPKLRDLIGIVGGMVCICVLVIPAGLLSGFLKYNSKGTVMLVLSYFVENFFTVALLEELIYRVFLIQAIALGPLASFKWRELWATLTASLLFGLMHWPRENKLETQLLYGLFAFLCGNFYAFAYRSSNNIFAPMILHATVDTVWGALLHT